MNSGIEHIAYGDALDPASLTYKADAETRWEYHNIYVKLQDVIAKASGQTWPNYLNTKLRDKIGMSSSWTQIHNNSVLWSTTRSMARFGALMLNKGKWDTTTILNETYFNEATNTSQNINLGYGYLCWLNGKKSYHLPQSQLKFKGSLIPTGPNDMFTALAKNNQKIYVIPSKKMVVFRMGDVANPSNPAFALSGFDEELWTKLSSLYR